MSDKDSTLNDDMPFDQFVIEQIAGVQGSSSDRES